MSIFEWSKQCFNIASVLYAITFLFYAWQLVSVKKGVSCACSWLARLSWGVHTAALILRWVEAGLAHPPWTNLYESLVFFSWAVMGIHLLIELRFDFKLSGVFATALTFVAMGIASLHPHKEIEPLVPALQSWWLLFHVFMASIAYAFFLASSFISVFHLLKEETKLERMSGVACLTCLLFLCIAVGKSFFLGQGLQFFKVVQMNGVDQIMNFKGPDGKPLQEFIELPLSKYFLWPILSMHLLAAVGFLKDLKPSKWILHTAVLLQAAFIVYLFTAPQHLEAFSLKSNPYKLAAFIMTFGIALFFSVLFFWKEKIVLKLPKIEVLDRLSYEAILLGVPFMTLNLVSGAVWAYYAWGRYWGWDPKETWALITWLVYVIYLHMRILGGWKGKKTALISILGFFVVIFTYLGVNLVISGLHSYATG